jgi:hypothetical protein
MTDLERAMLDIAEVRERLAMTQRFRGYSGVAAAASGCFAILAGVVQALLAPVPAGAHQDRMYAAIWLACGGAAMIVNYASIAHWAVSDESNHYTLLPGIWCACYGVGLFASRTLVPRPVVPIAATFMLIGIALLFAPSSLALAWWVLPLIFGPGQIAIGFFVARDRVSEA